MLLLVGFWRVRHYYSGIIGVCEEGVGSRIASTFWSDGQTVGVVAAFQVEPAMSVDKMLENVLYSLLFHDVDPYKRIADRALEVEVIRQPRQYVVVQLQEIFGCVWWWFDCTIFNIIFPIATLEMNVFDL